MWWIKAATAAWCKTLIRCKLILQFKSMKYFWQVRFLLVVLHKTSIYLAQVVMLSANLDKNIILDLSSV